MEIYPACKMMDILSKMSLFADKTGLIARFI